MRCVVTGAAGFLGSHLCENLLGRGHTVVGIDAFVPDYAAEAKARNQSILLAHPHYHFHAIDLRTDPLEAVVAGADVVFHLAGRPGLPASWADFDGCWTCNVLGTQRLLDALRYATPYLRRLVLASSSSVYGWVALGSESTPALPVSPQGVTMLAAEQLGRAYAEAYGIPLVILRYFSVYGPRQRPDGAYFQFLTALAAGTPLPVYGDGKQVRSPTYVSDAVSATVAAAEAPAGETYNVGGNEPATVLDVIQKLESITGQTATLRFLPPPLGDQRQTVADTTKIRNHLGWTAKIRLEEGLARQWQWQAEEPKLPSRPSRTPVRSASVFRKRAYT